MKKSYEYYYQNDNGEEKEKYYIDGKEVTGTKYYNENSSTDSSTTGKAISNIDDERFTRSDKAQSKPNLGYHTSKEFNIFETVKFLSEHPDWRAKHEIDYYKYDELDKIFIVDNKEKSRILINALNWKFKLIPPKQEEKWVDTDVKVGIRMLFNKYTDKLRSINTKNCIDKIYDCTNINSITSQEIAFNRWQYLDKGDK